MVIEINQEIKSIISQNLKVVKKTKKPLLGSDEYYAEKNALVDAVTQRVMEELDAHDVNSQIIASNKEHILTVIDAVVKTHKNKLQAILDNPEVRDNPAYVRKNFALSGFYDSMAEEVWKGCKDQVARTQLKDDFINIVKTKVFSESINDYPQYRDRDILINYIVEHAMQRLPENSSAELIEQNRVHLLKGFTQSLEGHQKALNDFLKENRALSTSDRIGVRGYSKSPVYIRVGKDFDRKFVTKDDREEKIRALDELMHEISQRLEKSFPAARGRVYGDYKVQRDALVIGTVASIRKRLLEDKEVTTEMLYNNRNDILKTAEESAKSNIYAVNKFLQDWRVPGVDNTQQLQNEWSKKGSVVTDNIYGDLVQKIKVNTCDPNETKQFLVSFHKLFKKIVAQKIEKGSLSTNVVDAMCTKIADHAIHEIGEKNMSFGDLRRDRKFMIQAFHDSVDDHISEIQSRVEFIDVHLKEEKLSWVGKIRDWFYPIERSSDTMHKRVGEEKDVEIIDDIAEKFSRDISRFVPLTKPREALVESSQAANMKRAQIEALDVRRNIENVHKEAKHKPAVESPTSVEKHRRTRG